MTEALAKLWVRFLPEIENRLAIVSKAADSLATGTLSEEEREQAHQAAHKLAGVLGSFGLPEGTELARRAELLLAAKPPESGAAELSGWAQELKQRIATRTP